MGEETSVPAVIIVSRPYPPSSVLRPSMFTYILLALIAGLLTGMLIAWYRRQD